MYVLRCSDNSLYTGYTKDLNRRMKEHNNGKGSKYTKPRLPVRLVRVEIFSGISSAMSREYSIKQLTKNQKESLVGSADDYISIEFKADL